jgi:hypothetical protein
MYILDTNVISELRISKRRTAPSVRKWADSVPTASLYLSAVTVLELETGVLLLERRDAEQGETFRDWLDNQVMPAFADRILPINTTIAKRCATLHVPDRRPDRDAFIAATALVHDMTVVTRNTTDFARMDVATVDPWLSSPADQ